MMAARIRVSDRPASSVGSSHGQLLLFEEIDFGDHDNDSTTSSDQSLPTCWQRFTCSYRLPWMKSKGAILVLIWNFLVLSCVSGAYTIILSGAVEHLSFIPRTYAWKLTTIKFVRFSVWVFYPLAGWLADTYFGRYKTIRFSMWIIWVSALNIVIFSLLLFYYPENHRLQHAVWYGIYPVLFVTLTVGVAGFQANVIPFGTDQMEGASAEELATFIRWYFWTEYFGFGIVYTFLGCVSIRIGLYELIQALIQASCMTLALALEFVFRNWLAMEPHGGNPLENTYQVLKFAKQHKFPRQRSAFTYWEDNIPSRIDCAKRRYGGPFTSEQVEDVRSFLHITMILCSLVAIFIPYVAVFDTIGLLASHLISASDNCYERNVITNLNILVIVCGVPFYHFIIYPLILNCIPKLLQRMGLAAILVIVNVLFIFIIVAVGHIHSHNVPCILLDLSSMSDKTSTLDISFLWLAIPNFISGLTYLTIGTATYEFICAQGPYRMKGLLIGLFFGTFGFTNALVLVLLVLYLWLTSHHNPSPGCAFWFYLISLVLSVVGVLVFWAAARSYKPRQRNELSFGQVQIEEHYDRAI